MKKLHLLITGKSPMLMHSDRLADPLDPMTKAHKELTAKRLKTDDDHTAIALSEFIGASYWNEASGFYIPAQNLDSCLVAASKLQKLGVKFKQGVQVMEDELSLLETLPTTPQKLWQDKEYVDARGVKVSQAKIIRYRPIFKQWSVKATVLFSEEVVNASQVKKAIQDAGALIGLGDYRPRFGRFTTEIN